MGLLTTSCERKRLRRGQEVNNIPNSIKPYCKVLINVYTFIHIYKCSTLLFISFRSLRICVFYPKKCILCASRRVPGPVFRVNFCLSVPSAACHLRQMGIPSTGHSPPPPPHTLLLPHFSSPHKALWYHTVANKDYRTKWENMELNVNNSSQAILNITDIILWL